MEARRRIAVEIKYTLERVQTEMTVQELIEHYYDQEQFEKLCKECGNYGNVWTCPPFNFSPRDYINKYKNIQLFGTIIRFGGSVREQSAVWEEERDAAGKIIHEIKMQADQEFLEMEKKSPGVRMLSSGGCILCTRCARTAGLPCHQKGKMRYSLEALGCNVSELAEKKLGVPLLWANGRLPEYYMLVNGLLRS